ncbi:hypothetical protein PZA11_006097 [Diplocarpon coronariae]|uniref:Uncharacterized protein n=1 Tax=Diplocarpon coronariae TaxID=2795749 RepID=A0A218YUK4_9HELO|nr:hypothetical protein JHW43_001614 [Diplocarpon mali]OWO99255.1 hypothetical protein B2J93_1143 [Marssonina coronariae]
MAQGGRPTSTIDVLQSMINGILIETGKALRHSKKDGSRSLDAVNTRLRTTIPTMAEHFHEALDDLESDIVRAKAVLGRDLERLRAKRTVLEDPVPILPGVPAGIEPGAEAKQFPDGNIATDGGGSSPKPAPKQHEGGVKSPEQPTPFEQPRPVAVMTSQPSEVARIPNGPTPPAPLHDLAADSKQTGLALDTQGATAASVAEPQKSSVSSLFGNIDQDKTGEPAPHLDDVNLSNLGPTSRPQNTSQTQNSELDLSGFHLPDHGTSTQTTTNPTTQPKQEDLSGAANTSGGSNMDIDMGMAGAEESVFDDMFFGDADDTGIGGGGEMQHGDFDNAFFGLD